MKRTLRITGCAWWLLVAGCGTDLGEALLFAGESAGRTFLDVILSDFYSDAPDLVTFPGGRGDTADDDEAADDTTQGDTTDTEPNDTAPPDGGDVVDLIGDADRGATVYAASFCAGCHCDDASGGCLPTAPDIRGDELITLTDVLQGNRSHVGGAFPDLTPQDTADLQTFLAR